MQNVWPSLTSVTVLDKCDRIWQVWLYLTSVTTCDKCDHIFLRNKDKLYIITIWQIQSLSDPRADYLIRYTFQSQFPILVNSNQAWSKHEQTCSNLLTSCLKYLVSDIHQKKNYSLKNCIPYRDLFIPSPRPIELEGNMDARSAATKADWVSKSDVNPAPSPPASTRSSPLVVEPASPATCIWDWRFCCWWKRLLTKWSTDGLDITELRFDPGSSPDLLPVMKDL